MLHKAKSRKKKIEGKINFAIHNLFFIFEQPIYKIPSNFMDPLPKSYTK